MTLLGLLILLVVGAVCGAAAELLVGWSVGGFFASAVVGFLGALIGGWIARAAHLPSVLAVNIDTVTIDFVWAILGAVVLLAILGLLRRGRYVRP
jgi:uncharacterized membrane protein YeaQ/YmgE (transglycosylase-associated protein family)